jgi:hypothetical protein
MKKYFIFILIISCLIISCKKNKSDSSFKETIKINGEIGNHVTEDFEINSKKIKIIISIKGTDNELLEDLINVTLYRSNDNTEIKSINFSTKKGKKNTIKKTIFIKKITKDVYYLRIDSSSFWTLVLSEKI